MIWRSLKFGLKLFGMIVLMIVAMNLWNIFSPQFLPGTPPEIPTFDSLETELEERAKARQAGPEAEAEYLERREREHPFDNHNVINYILPLFLVWLLNSLARARNVSPLTILGGFTSIWFFFALASWLMNFAFDSVGAFFLILGLVFVLLRFAPGPLATAVFRIPRRAEQALLDLLNDKSGWLARRFGGKSAKIGRSLAFLLLAGDAAWILWSMCDGVDGSGLPGTFALMIRTLTVAAGLFFLIRAHLHKHGDLFHPRDLLPAFESSSRMDRRSDTPSVKRRGRLRDEPLG